jgi:hypothetical protein
MPARSLLRFDSMPRSRPGPEEPPAGGERPGLGGEGNTRLADPSAPEPPAATESKRPGILPWLLLVLGLVLPFVGYTIWVITELLGPSKGTGP